MLDIIFGSINGFHVLVIAVAGMTLALSRT
jgi:hypothetical protein